VPETEVPFLRVSGVRKRFEGVLALRGVDLTVNKGEFLALLGPNGAGKTTLLKIIASLLKPDEGTVEFCNGKTGGSSTDFRKCMGFISHHAFLYPNLTARENLEFFGSLYGVGELRQRVDELLKELDLYNRRDYLVSGFSRGMLQRLSIARALIHDPELILLDEPFTGLDRHAASVLRSKLLELAGKGRTIIMVTHNIAQAVEIVGKIGILVRGKLIYLDHVIERNPAFYEEIYLETAGGAIRS